MQAISRGHQVFCNDVAGEEWDRLTYAPDTYDSFIWGLEKPVLLARVSALAQRKPNLKYLDFACGTGRVLAALEPLVAEAIGLDVSASMLARAAEKVPNANLKLGDLLQDPTVADYDYDLITAFRFFLNTESQWRQPVLTSLASRLRGRDSLVIFNVHGNSYGLDGLSNRFWGSPLCTTMSLPAIRDLIHEAGLSVQAWYGFGLTPGCRERLLSLRPLMRSIDRWAAGQPVFKAISRDLLFFCRPK